MAIDTIVLKIVASGILSLLVVWVLSPAITIYSTLAYCTNCNGLVYAFTIGVLPILIVFVGIYNIISVFSAKMNGGY